MIHPSRQEEVNLLVALVDSLTVTSKLISDSDLDHPDITEAIKDLYENGGLEKLSRIYHNTSV